MEREREIMNLTLEALGFEGKVEGDTQASPGSFNSNFEIQFLLCFS